MPGFGLLLEDKLRMSVHTRYSPVHIHVCAGLQELTSAKKKTLVYFFVRSGKEE